MRAGWDLRELEKQRWKPAKLIFALSCICAQWKEEFRIMLFVKICVYAPECTQGFKWIKLWDSTVTARAQSYQPLKSSSPCTL